MSMPNIVKRALWLTLIVLVSAALAAGASFVAIDVIEKEPAVVIKSAFDANSVTFRDGRIQLYFDVSKTRDCPMTTTRWLWTWVDYKGEKVRLFMPLGVALTGVSDIGEEKYILSLEVPAGVWDGEWYYYARSVTRCGGLLSLIRDEVSEVPSVPIQIKGSSGKIPTGVRTTTAPTDTKIPVWRKAIITDGKPLP